MSKNFQEPEEVDMDKQNSDILDDFNPLDEPVVEKEYTKHNVKINPNDFKTDIPEPDFTPPPMSGMMNEEQKDKPKKPSEPYNPEMKEMSNKDKNDAAGKVAEMVMTMYKWVNSYADSKLQFDERKLNKLQMEGELDLSIPFPFNQQVNMTAGEMIEEYNQQTKDTIYVSDKFEQETTPVLIKVLSKRGIGMSDEQYLAFLFGKDMLYKTFQINQSLSIKKDILNQLKELTAAYKSGGSMPQPQPMQQPSQAPPPPTEMYDFTQEEEVYQAPKRKYNPEENVNDMVNMMTGSISPDEMSYEEPIPNDDYEEYAEPKTKSTKKQSKKTNTKRGRAKRS